ncbi:MAG: APC family permease [Candidatus Riflebacteria bacterium]|nr:APC family permease [Candidatus Riflebacteria bacterium]
MQEPYSFLKHVKHLIIGEPRDPHDREIFHKITLIAFLAWVGLGADGITSSCYGPEEAFRALGGHSVLSIIVGLGCALTVFVIATSYSQIIELFPTGGGGYLVASKLLSPNVGMISGCALLVDYVLTITLSIASGADALFSFFPEPWNPYKFWFALFGVFGLLILNLRGVKESVIPLVPVFLIFIFAHAFLILYAIISHLMQFSTLSHKLVVDLKETHSQLGSWGMFLIILKAYSMSAGTYTGIEAVSNGLPILKEPRVETGKKTMTYMAVSLASIVLGLMIAYVLFDAQPSATKTLNAVLCEKAFGGFGTFGTTFIFITLVSEAALLFVGAQAGFLDGPRVLANMAQDRWFPTRFALLSDRLVTQNGILLMGVSSLILMVMTHGSVGYMIVLYSINVFITFSLSQIGMVKHWWNVRSTTPDWKRKLFVNGVGLSMTLFVLLSVIYIKFFEGGWITIIITGTLVLLALGIKSHYNHAFKLLQKFNGLVDVATIPGIKSSEFQKESKTEFQCDLKGNTAVLLVNGFNGQGIHTLMSIIGLFKSTFKNFAFIQIGMIDAGNFKGSQEVDALEKHAHEGVQRYVDFMKNHGYYSEGFTSISVDVVEETMKISQTVRQRFPNSTFFGGQLVFPEDTFITRMLHNNIVFSVQRRFLTGGLPFVIIPVVV